MVEGRQMQMLWNTDAGPVSFTYPSNLSTQEVEDVSELLAIAVTAMKRRAEMLKGEVTPTTEAENG